MFHFRHLLSPKTQFIWTEDLDWEFELAKASKYSPQNSQGSDDI